MNMSFLEKIRDYEISQVLPLIPPGALVLEIGSGAGWQSLKLQEHGALVTAIDVEQSSYLDQKIFPVTIYDGRNIPFPDGVFDVVFSSNTLEHIPHVEEFQSEIQRVLKPDGIAIHIVPSTEWRWWTIIGLYFHLPKILSKLFYNKIRGSRTNQADYGIENYQISIKTIPHRLVRMALILIPTRHGERGNVATELFLFSRHAWQKLFLKMGWVLTRVYRNRLFYTGYLVMGSMMSLKTRHLLSFVLGSSCHIFVMKKPE